MIFLVLMMLFIGIVYFPQFWVRYVLRKYSTPLDGMPGTGGELAQHLLSRFGLDDVVLEQSTPHNDHYSPAENTVRLSPDVYNGKSLTAIAVAAHEVGHAIQFNRKEPVSYLRERYLGKALYIKKIGVFALMALPLIGIVVRAPQLMLVTMVIGVITMFVSVLMYVAILPEEFDASFNKALPILQQGDYVPEVYLPAIKKILKACAYTYVAGALADILRLWRWLRLVR